MAQLVKNPPAVLDTWVRSLGWEDSLEKGKGYPLQVFWPGEFMNYTVHGVSKSQTQLSDFYFHFHPQEGSLSHREQRAERIPLPTLPTAGHLTLLSPVAAAGRGR